MAAGLQYLKMPRNVTEYTLMKGVTDFSNLKQFDLFETGYSFLTVVGIPRFLEMKSKQDTDVLNLLNGFIHIVEGEFKGLSGLPNITMGASEISNGAYGVNLINNVEMDTSISVSMEFYERSGSLITKLLQYYATGIKDPYSKAKTYHGLIGSSITDPGPQYETFTFLYYVTDNTMRRVEKAYLLCNAQPTEVPLSTLYESQRGNYEFPTISLSFNCFPIMGDNINKYASLMLENDLNDQSTTNSRKIVVDSNDYKWYASDSSKDIISNSRVYTPLTKSLADPSSEFRGENSKIYTSSDGSVKTVSNGRNANIT